MVTRSFLIALVTLGSSALLSAQVPKGWWAARSDDYRVVVDRTDAALPAAGIESAVPEPEQFFALNQTISAEDYRGKRVRFSGEIRTENVAKWTGLWLRVDNSAGKIVAFDSMQQRGRTGTLEWTKGEIVLDVPFAADRIVFGLILDGSGKSWMRGLKLEVVDESVPVTGRTMNEVPKTPVNLDFRE